MLERDNKNWEDVQKSFIRKLQTLIPKHGNKFKAHLVQGGPGRGQGQQRGKHSDAQYAAYKEAVKEGTGVHKDIYRKLLANMRKRLIEAKKKKSNDGGLGTQYQVQQGTLQPGTILAPVEPQGRTETPPCSNVTPTGSDKNQNRAMHLCQLTNGTYQIRNQRFHLSSQVSTKMSVQSYQMRENYKGNLWIDSGTNISAMGRTFQFFDDTKWRANMTGFANNLKKEDIPIGSGLTKITIPHTGFQCLLGLHEAPYLPNNDSSLLSTNQA